MDYRETNKTIIDSLVNNPSIKLEIGKLKTGDFLIAGQLLIERKTLKDLVISIKDGRIFQQAARLASSSKYSLIILEDTSLDIQSIKMKREAIQGVLICLSLKFQIPILRSMSPKETGKLILLACHQVLNSRQPKRNFPNRPGPFKRNNKRKQQMYILQGLPGIGPARAQALLDKFGTLQSVFTVSISELEETMGIGKYTAKKIISILNEDSITYYPYLKPKGES